MLGMIVVSFPILALIAAGVAVAYHNVIRNRVPDSDHALVGKLIVGWLGELLEFCTHV